MTNARILRQIGLPNTAAFPAGLLDEGASVSMDLGGEKERKRYGAFQSHGGTPKIIQYIQYHPFFWDFPWDFP